MLPATNLVLSWPRNIALIVAEEYMRSGPCSCRWREIKDSNGVKPMLWNLERIRLRPIRHLLVGFVVMRASCLVAAMFLIGKAIFGIDLSVMPAWAVLK